MMTQGVMTQTVNLFGNAPAGVTSKGKQNTGSFDLMMDSSMRSGINNNTENTTVRKASDQNADNSSNKSDAVSGGDKQSVDSKPAVTKTENQKTAEQADNQAKKTLDATQTEAVKSKDTEEPIPDEATMEKIAGLLESVKQTVMELLNLSSEEFDQLLTEQGFTVTDLLEPQNLQELVLANSEATDILAVLTDENLADTMNQLLQSVEKLTKEADLNLSPEQMKRILDDAKLQMEGKVVTTREEMTGEKSNTEQASKPEIVTSTQQTKQDNILEATKSVGSKDITVEVTKATDTKENSSQTHSDSGRSDNQEVKAAEQFEAFLSNLTKASTSTQVDFNGNLVQVTEIREIANQILERVKVNIRPEQTSMEMQLNPENLGKVNLSVQSRNGVMTAQFVVQNEISKEAIESQLNTLKETLNQQGIKVEAIEVTVAAYSFEQNNNQNTQSQEDAKQSRTGNRISLEEAVNMTEETEEAAVQEDVTGIRGSQIDYTA